MQTKDCRQKSARKNKQTKKKTMQHWKYSYYNKHLEINQNLD